MVDNIIEELGNIFVKLINLIPNNEDKQFEEFAYRIESVYKQIKELETKDDDEEKGGMSVGGSKYLTEGETLDPKKSYTCELCHGKYTGAHRSAHVKTRMHRIAEAKDYGEFDFRNYEIINNKNQLKEDAKKLKQSAKDAIQRNK